MGAVNPDRLAEFIDRYRSFDDPDIPSFMYGSHYSTAVGVVLHYLVRLQPFAELHKEMQVRSALRQAALRCTDQVLLFVSAIYARGLVSQEEIMLQQKCPC